MAGVDSLLSDLPNEDDLPRDDQAWTVYRDWLMQINTAANFFERGKGWITYLQGEALNRCIASKELKRGDYTALLKAIGMRKGTAYNCRRIAARFAPNEARRKGFAEMLRILKWETLDSRNDLTHDAPELDDTETPDSDPGGKGQTIDPNAGHPNKDRPKPRKQSTVDYDNHAAKLASLVKLAASLTRFQPNPPVELADAETYYDAIRTEAEKARRSLTKTIQLATRQIASLTMSRSRKAS